MSRMITKIEIRKLFGKYDYILPTEGELKNPAILYGDNGVGKSTILKIAFDLLSTANDQGHRGALSEIDFKYVRIYLNNGHAVEAFRNDITSKDVMRMRTYKVTPKSGDAEKLDAVTEWIYGLNRLNHFPEGFEVEYRMFEDGISFNDRHKIVHLIKETQRSGKKRQDNVERGNGAYLRHLAEICPRIYYLNADRKLVGDFVKNDIDDILAISRVRAGDAKSLIKAAEELKKSSLTAALNSASKWFQVRAVRDTNRGSEDVHQTYGSIVNRLANAYGPELDNSANEVSKLISEIEAIKKTTENYSRFELTSALDMSAFTNALTVSSGGVEITYRLLSPYIESLRARLDATKGIYEEILSFVNTVNGFLVGKSIKYALSRGLYLEDDRGDPLQAENLSSGEQQLLLMFCNVLAARDEESVFIIDEPEISLNIKWQRKLVGSLSAISGNSKTQYIFASHSFEIIAQHRSYVVKVERIHD